jgi:exosortase C (VPDSG-CTERM-specific)
MMTDTTAVAPSAVSASRPGAVRRIKPFALFALVLITCFSRPLYSLVQFAIHSDLYSHIVLIPFVSGYLLWLHRKNLINTYRPCRGLAPFLCSAGFAFLLVYWWLALSGKKFAAADFLALMTSSFLSFFAGASLFFVGSANLKKISFSLAFLVFMIPFPTTVENAIESFLQQGSASAACGLFTFSGMPVFKQEMELHLPGFNMHVAPECSGIHSSLVLFIVSLVAGHLLLRANWARAIFVLAVIPLAMLRNGFRIFVLGELCVRVDPGWIHSDLHRRGGPLFFALSLIPFFALLLLLRRLEVKRKGTVRADGSNPSIAESTRISLPQIHKSISS